MIAQRIFLIFFSLWLLIPIQAQLNYTRNHNYLKSDDIHSAIPVGIVDVNGDGRDDVVRLDDGKHLNVAIRAANKDQFVEYEYPNAIRGEVWSLVVGDLDDDGINEIILSGFYTGSLVYQFNPKTFAIEQRQVTAPDYYTQGTNLVDLNLDGALDLFVCDDNDISDIFINNGSGQLTEADDFINMTTLPVSDNSGNYGSEFMDIDSDGDLDLYLAKCKAGAITSEDPRRINMLFINDGNNNFTNRAQELGLDSGEQSWVVSSGDLDNDGDIDLFLLEHTAPYAIYENIDNERFVKRTDLLDGVEGIDLNAVIRDFDNNGYLDICLGGFQNKMFLNQGNMVFTQVEQPLPYYRANSFSFGDINRDGNLDVYATYGAGVGAAGSLRDILWINEGNENNYVNFSLIGRQSNTNGIGSRIELYGPWGIQIRDVKAGESYGLMNSLNVNFGIGEYATVDSVIIKWPSKVKDIYRNVDINRFYELTEGICIREVSDNLNYETDIFCSGETIDLNTSLGSNSVWSNNETGSSIQISETAPYFSKFTTPEGCKIRSETIFMEKDPVENANISVSPGDEVCFGSEVELSVNANDNVFWSTGENGNSIMIQETGQYSATYNGACDTYTESIFIEMQESGFPFTQNDTIEKGDDAVLIATGNGLKWYTDVDSEEPFHSGDTLRLSQLDQSTTFFVSTEDNFRRRSFVGGEPSQVGSNNYSGNTVNPATIFEIYEPIIFEEFTVYTDIPGIRKFEIVQGEEIVFSLSIVLNRGKNIIDVNALLEPGTDYSIRTGAEQNLESFGFVGPRLERSNRSTHYPYEIEDLLTITNSESGTRGYYFFYDWSIRRPDHNCESRRVSISAIVNEPSSAHQIEEIGARIFPNPTSDIVHIHFPSHLDLYSFWLYDNLGNRHRLDPQTSAPGELSFSVDSVAKGIYYIYFQSDNRLYSTPLIILQ